MGTVSVSARINAADDIPGSAINFRFVNSIVLSSVSPNMVPTVGGITITVLGAGFVSHPLLQCIFCSAVRSVATFISSQQIQCPLPNLLPGVCSVEVSYNDEQFSSSDVKLKVNVTFPSKGFF